jgi:hypothetical protein
MHDALLQPKETAIVMGLGDGEVTSCKCLSLTCVFEYKCAKPLVSELIISL